MEDGFLRQTEKSFLRWTKNWEPNKKKLAIRTCGLKKPKFFEKLWSQINLL